MRKSRPGDICITLPAAIALLMLCARIAAYHAQSEVGWYIGLVLAFPIAIALIVFDSQVAMRLRTRIALCLLTCLAGVLGVHTTLSPPHPRDLVRQFLGAELPVTSEVRMWREDPFNAANYFLRFGASTEECAAFAARAGLAASGIPAVSKRASTPSGSIELPDWWSPPALSGKVWSGERDGRIVRLVRSESNGACFLEIAVPFPR